MVVINGVSAKEILDSRKEGTIFISIKTKLGKEFSASSPNGKSTGKYEERPYKKSLEEDIKTLKKFGEYFSEEIIEEFEDLKRVEDILEGHIGANSLFAFESAVLKAIAYEQKKGVWKIINPAAKNFPRLVGNCIGGGKHSELLNEKKPDFQEFLLIPNSKSPEKAEEINKKAKEKTEILLKKRDFNFKNTKNDEGAWMTSMNEKEVLDILKELNLPAGVDVASSSFYKRKKYSYENPPLKRNKEEQLSYLANLIKNFDLLYIEDPFDEEDFEDFSKLLKKFPGALIVGDDLTVTSSKRLQKAIKMKSINALIVKPNQCGSLLEVKKVCEIAKENNIKIIFSHRSGETEETILADLAFGFQADFFKCGITGKEREAKINRLIEIEKSLK
ncbi:MAG: enolase C-terminal domain-like protein [Candidatus Diapherotrites archaeon]